MGASLQPCWSLKFCTMSCAESHSGQAVTDPTKLTPVSRIAASGHT